VSNINYEEGWGRGDHLTSLERVNLIRQKFSTEDKNLLVGAVFSRLTGINEQTISAWKNAKKGIQPGKKADICKAFNLRYQVWTDSFKSYEENVFFQKLDDYLIDTPKEMQEEKNTDTSHIDAFIYDSLLKISAEEEDKLAFFAKDHTIVMPGNLEQYSPDFMFALSEHLKTKGQASDALHVLEVLQTSTHSFKYLHRKEILHLQAILLSEKTVQKWDEAIEILRYLYADSYHLEQPEIVTLTASNYKRKALYHPNGMLNHVDYVDTEALGNALSLYYEAYALKAKNEKYYDAINIAYIERILDILESEEGEENADDTIKKLFKEVYDTATVDMKNWWEVTSQIEFYVLMGNDANAVEIYEAYEGTPSRFELETTIRQIEIYVHYSDDGMANGFLELLKKDLEEL